MRRSITPNSGTPMSGRAAKRSADYERANLSVLDMRMTIAATRLSLRPRSLSFAPINVMVRACNDYLETSSTDPGVYVAELDKLRKDLGDPVDHLRRLNRLKLTNFAPGMGALTNSVGPRKITSHTP